METLKPYGALAGRILLVVLFIMSGFSKLGAIEGTQGYMASAGVPGFLIWPTIALELLGGLAIVAGYQTRILALALALFSIVSGALFHYVPADQFQMIMFMKNIGLAGGFLMLATHGAGSISVDAALARRQEPALA